MKTIRLLLAGAWAVLAAGACLGAGDPFTVTASLDAAGSRLSVTFAVPKGHYLYSERISVDATGGLAIKPLSVPDPKRKYDSFSEAEVGIYEHDVAFVYAVEGPVTRDAGVSVSYQGCNDSLCFLPQTVVLALAAAGGAAAAPEAAAAGQGEPVGWPALAARFEIPGVAAGYLPPEDFVRFLDSAESGGVARRDSLREALESGGTWLGVLLVLLGGLALNLTPCVLPMIPVNLAIIGAGAGAGSRRRGFALGSAYGVGMALAYGVLGLLVLLTGARFGTLNSSPWFNLGVAVLFAALGVAMFDVFSIDLSRFHGAGAPRGGGAAAALALGAVAALLAGACVAPVVLSVLLVSADMHARGQALGLVLPFLLGVGMALPWPFAGAGLSWLPKPGRWMVRVKHAFGVIILLGAAWYGYLAYSLASQRAASSRESVEQAMTQGGWETSLEAGLARALAEGKPVFVDMWASWCKNCLKMEHTTFRDAGVTQRLEPYVKVRFRAENVRDPAIKAVLDHFKAVGLPTYAVMKPRAQP